MAAHHWQWHEARGLDVVSEPLNRGVRAMRGEGGRRRRTGHRVTRIVDQRDGATLPQVRKSTNYVDNRVRIGLVSVRIRAAQVAEIAPHYRGGLSRGEILGVFGWGGRIRTYGARYQKPVPYHLATPHQRGAEYDERGV